VIKHAFKRHKRLQITNSKNNTLFSVIAFCYSGKNKPLLEYSL